MIVAPALVWIIVVIIVLLLAGLTGAVDVGMVHPANKIVLRGTPLVQSERIETVANMYPGRLVKRDTTDGDMEVNTVGNPPTGWLGYEQASGDYKPATEDTIYVVNDIAPRLFGGGFVIIGRIKTGEGVITKGDFLTPGAAGELLKAVAINVDSGTTAVTSIAANGAVISGSLLDAPIVAIAQETVDATSAAKDCAVLSLI